MLIPEENEKDLADIPAKVKESLEIIPVTTMDQVLSHALVRAPEAIEWNEPEAKGPVPSDDGEPEPVMTH